MDHVSNNIEKFIQRRERENQMKDRIFGSRGKEVVEEDQELIAKALLCIPEEVVDFVSENVTFRGGHCYTNKEDIREAGVIHLTGTEGIDVILHEIAHAFLGHRINVDDETDRAQEQDAINLAKEWEDMCP